MKISIIGPTYPFRGGIAHYTTLLTKELRKKHEVDLISFKRLFPKFLYPGRDQKDFSGKFRAECVYLLDSINPISWFNVYLRIRKKNSDLLIFNWWTTFFSIQFTTISSLTRIFTKTKILILCHNVLPHEKSFLDKFLTKIFFLNSGYFIVHSNEEKKNLNSIVKNKKVIVTPHPTYDIFNIKKISKIEAKKKIDSLNKRIILFFGLIRESKGLIFLIRAMPIILKKINVELLIVGEFFGKSEKKYLEEIKKLNLNNNIKIIDKYIPDEEVNLYFSASDVVILPYISGTGSGVLQIAFGLNKPVICTNVGFSEDIVNGKTGFIVNKEDSDALAMAIIKYYEEGREKEFSKNITNSKNKFSWEKMINLLEECVS